jgi:uncharacterized protein
MDSPVPWFSFNLSDFSVAFLSVLLEGVPFILLGTLLSGFIDQFLPARVMTRLLPRNPYLGVVVSALLGIIFPMCECGIIPLIRRLLGKGLPLSNAVAYMLAAPIVNPIVALSTYAAFRGQGAAEMTALRLGLGFVVSVIGGCVIQKLPTEAILRRDVFENLLSSGETNRSGPFGARVLAALNIAMTDFLDVCVYFTFGVALSAIFSTSVNQDLITPLATNNWLAVGSMMLLAIILALCSTSNAFIAATFVAFPAVSKLAFLVFGPMFDFKLIFIYSSVFKKRFVLALGVALYFLIGLLCVRLSVINL